MASKARISLLEAGSLPSGRRDGSGAGHRAREFIKFSLAVSAVGSAAFGAYQALQQPEPPRRAAEVRREEVSGPQKSFFQALIEADREALSKRAEKESAAMQPRWKGFEGFAQSSEPARLVGPPDKGSTPRDSLRAHFTLGDPQVAPTAAQGGWDMAFLSSSIPKRQTAAATPPSVGSAAPRPSQPAGVQQRTVPQPSPPQVAPAPQMRGPTAAVPASDVRNPPQAASAPKPVPPKPAAGGFREVHAGQLQQPTPVSRDDLEFAAAVVAAAERDFDYLPRAQAVVAEFSRRYPQAPEVSQLRSRQAAVRQRHAVAMAERSTASPDTRVAPVLFEPDARASMVACLSKIEELQRLSAVNRPVSSTQDRLAFLVAATVTPSGGLQGREQHLEETRQRIAPALGACLSPLFAKGTVALALTDGQDTDITRQRIDGTDGATIFQRQGAATGRS